ALRALAIAAVAVLALASPRLAAAAPRLELVGTAGRVTVRAEPGLEKVARQLAASGEQALAEISADLADLTTPKAIEVQLIRNASDLAAVAPAGRGAPAWAIGVAYPDLGIISVAIRRGAELADPQATLRHELAHIALGAALGDRAPHWLHEGFAYQHSRDWSLERAETLAGMAWMRGVIDLAELDRAFPAGELPAHRAYAESYDFVGFLAARGRWDDQSDAGDRWPFRRFLRALGQGSELDAAAKTAFGKPIRALFEEWKSDLGNRYMLAPIGLLGFVLWVLCALLLALAWWRRRRQNQRRMAAWDLEEQLRRAHEPPSPAAASPAPAQVFAPPYVPWPGEDPLTSEPEDDDGKPSGDPTRWLN
ncbi:MAG TPA: hypothetical protein VFP84_15230, partial [Kofleriaceae bacterium]|nr:hypothetical protein [Kofleriaceae bacterium]